MEAISLPRNGGSTHYETDTHILSTRTGTGTYCTVQYVPHRRGARPPARLPAVDGTFASVRTLQFRAATQDGPRRCPSDDAFDGAVDIENWFRHAPLQPRHSLCARQRRNVDRAVLDDNSDDQMHLLKSDGPKHQDAHPRRRKVNQAGSTPKLALPASPVSPQVSGTPAAAQARARRKGQHAALASDRSSKRLVSGSILEESACWA